MTRHRSHVLHSNRLHSLQVGFGSPEITGVRGRLQKRAAIFSRVDRLTAPVLVAQVGEPSGSPVPVFRSSNLAWVTSFVGSEGGGFVNRNTGALTMMAGQLIGASAPRSSSSHPAARRAPLRVVASSRTRRNHGCFLVGDELTTVYSSRRTSEGRGVTVSIGNGSMLLSGSMTPVQARAFANALTAAAAAVEAGAQA